MIKCCMCDKEIILDYSVEIIKCPHCGTTQNINKNKFIDEDDDLDEKLDHFRKEINDLREELNSPLELFVDHPVARVIYPSSDLPLNFGFITAIINLDRTVSIAPKQLKFDLSNFENIKSIQFLYDYDSIKVKNYEELLDSVILVGLNIDGHLISNKKLPEKYNVIKEWGKLEGIYSNRYGFFGITERDNLKIVVNNNFNYVNSLSLNINQVREIKDCYLLTKSGNLYFFQELEKSVAKNCNLQNSHYLENVYDYMCCGDDEFYVVSNDGRVLSYGNNCDKSISKWNNIYSLMCHEDGIIGIKSHGQLIYSNRAKGYKKILEASYEDFIFRNFTSTGEEYYIIDNELIKIDDDYSMKIISSGVFRIDKDKTIIYSNQNLINEFIEEESSNVKNLFLHSISDLVASKNIYINAVSKSSSAKTIFVEVHIPKVLVHLEDIRISLVGEVYENGVAHNMRSEFLERIGEVLRVKIDPISVLHSQITGIKIKTVYMYHKDNLVLYYNKNKNIKFDCDISSLKVMSFSKSEPPKKKEGCYIATCVYGSYDCPQVIILRRYRDQKLLKKWWGKIFVKFYYFTSPKLVKLFGKSNWFVKPIKHILDSKIKKILKKEI